MIKYGHWSDLGKKQGRLRPIVVKLFQTIGKIFRYSLRVKVKSKNKKLKKKNESIKEYKRVKLSGYCNLAYFYTDEKHKNVKQGNLDYLILFNIQSIKKAR